MTPGRSLSRATLLLALFLPTPGPAFVLNPQPPAAGFAMNLDLGTAPIQTLGYGLANWNQLAESALATWNQAGIGSAPDFAFFKVRNPAVAGDACARDGVNEVRWASNHCGFEFGDAVAVTRQWSRDGARTEADVIFNNQVSWNAYPTQMVQASGGGWLHDFFRIALHEFGHVAGLDHPDQVGQTVKALMNSGEGDIDALQADDIAGGRAIAWTATSITSIGTVATTTTTTLPTGAALDMQSYFPFEPGFEWTYREDDGVSVTTYKRSVAALPVAIDGVATFDWTDSKGVSRYMTNDASGVRRHASRAPVSQPGSGTVTVSTNYSPPEMYAPASVQLGGSATQRGTVDSSASDGSSNSSESFSVASFDAEAVAVPAGTFDTVRITQVRIANRSAVTNTLWVANGIGIVKLRYDTPDGSLGTFSLASINFIPRLGATLLNLVAGWNLAGFGASGTVDVAATFGDPAKVLTVWKWNARSGKWAIYSPALDSQALADYAGSKGYEVLATINGGEGFWVNATTGFTAQLPAGTAITSTSLQNLPSGWNLIAIGDYKTPSQLNAVAGATAPLLTLWAWDPARSNWYFHAPNLEAAGGTALAEFIAGKGYLDFVTSNKPLAPGVGFWVNKP